MSNKLFYRCSDSLYISSYRKSNIRAPAEHCIRDIQKLNRYLHKIVLLRLCVMKFMFIHIISRVHINPIYMSDLCSMLITHLNSSISADNTLTLYQMFRISHVSYFNTFSNVIYDTYCLFLGYYCLSTELFKFALFYKRGLCSLPTNISKFTVLRSPHTDKKSREQFSMRIYKKAYGFPAIVSDYYSFLCESHYAYLLCTLVHERNLSCSE